VVERRVGRTELVPGGRHRTWRTVAVLVAALALVLSSCSAGDGADGSSDGSGSSGDPAGQGSDSGPQFLERPEQIPELLYDEFGEMPRLRRLIVSEDALSLELRDPAIPENLDTWRYADGEWTSTPVSVSQRDIDELDLVTFGPDAISWSAIPDLIDQAYAGVDLEEEEITSVSFDRISGDPPRIYIGVNGLRGSGRLLAGADGSNVEVVRN